MGEQSRVRRSKPLPFVQVATAILRDRELSGQARFLYSVLASYADLSSREAKLFRTTLADDIGKSVDTVDRLVKELVGAGVLSVMTIQDEVGRYQASVYSLHDADMISARREDDSAADVVAAPMRLPLEDGPETSPSGGRTHAATSPHPCGQGGRTHAAGVAAPVRHITRDLELDPENERTSPAETAADPPPPAKPKRRTAVEMNADRPDVEHLCALMVELVVANGSKRPVITEDWRTECRLMLDRDGRELDKAEALMRWATDHSFWRANIRSMPKFRQQYDALRLQGIDEWERAKKANRDDRPVQGQSLWERKVSNDA